MRNPVIAFSFPLPFASPPRSTWFNPYALSDTKLTRETCDTEVSPRAGRSNSQCYTKSVLSTSVLNYHYTSRHPLVYSVCTGRHYRRIVSYWATVRQNTRTDLDILLCELNSNSNVVFWLCSIINNQGSYWSTVRQDTRTDLDILLCELNSNSNVVSWLYSITNDQVITPLRLSVLLSASSTLPPPPRRSASTTPPRRSASTTPPRQLSAVFTVSRVRATVGREFQTCVSYTMNSICTHFFTLM